MKARKIIVIVVMGLFLLAACGGEEAVPTLLPAAATPAAGGGTPLPTTAGPTATLPAAPTLAATSSPAAEDGSLTDGSVRLVTEADFGDERNPLTGELVDDPAVLQRRPLAVKISNAPPTYVRPQSGLNDADLIFEHTAEGSVTRFTAIIYGEVPERVGPIRSARLIDLELPAMYDAALAYSGASVGVSRRLLNSDFSQRIILSSEQGYYRTGENKPFEHTLYGRPQEFWQALEAKGQNQPPDFNTYMAFSSQSPPGGQSAAQVTLDYNWTVVEWRYDAEIGRYRRWTDGEAHRDGNTGEQVTAANVIVISPVHVEDATICEEIRDGTCVHLSVQIQLWGSGSGAIFRDGQRYDVDWHRVNRNDMLTFTDSEGNPFPLQIGNSWVQVIPGWLSDPVTVGP
jgi:hypothetical protein